MINQNRRNGVFLKSIVLAGVAATMVLPALAQDKPISMEKGGMDQTGPYEPVAGWFKPGIDRWDQPVITVAIDNPDRIFIGQADQNATQPNAPMLTADGKVMDERSTTSTLPPEEKSHANMIMVLNGNGEVIERWTQWDDDIVISHNIEINPYDPERHLWVVDRDDHQIHVFTNDGSEMVMTLGEAGVPGTDETHFNRPAGLAFLPDGSFYVADGYTNARVVKFDKDGNYILEWGSKGSGPGQFDLVHSVTIDADQRVYVSDRNNTRIQVFDENGTFIEQWPNVGSPTRVLVTDDNSVVFATGDYDRIAKFNLNGELKTYWGVTGDAPGAMDNPHDFTVDDEGNLYIADAWNNRLQKLVPKQGADPARLVSPKFRFNAQ